MRDPLIDVGFSCTGIVFICGTYMQSKGHFFMQFGLLIDSVAHKTKVLFLKE